MGSGITVESYYTTADTATAVGAGLGAIFLVALFIGLALGIFSVICIGMIFEKADFAWWCALIPYYNVFVLFYIGTGNGWKMLWMFCPIANIVFAFQCCIGIAHNFGKSTGFGIGMILLPIIFLPMLAFDKNAKYIGD